MGLILKIWNLLNVVIVNVEAGCQINSTERSIGTLLYVKLELIHEDNIISCECQRDIHSSSTDVADFLLVTMTGNSCGY